MSFGIQTCCACGQTEEGGTGPGDRYICRRCFAGGLRVDEFGNVRSTGDIRKLIQTPDGERVGGPFHQEFQNNPWRNPDATA